MEEGVVLKRAAVQDAPVVLEIQRKVFAALLEKYRDDGNPAAESLEDVERRMDSPGWEGWRILARGRTVGFACVRRTESALVLSRFGLLPEWQGKGLGHRAMGLLEKEYPECSRWLLTTICQEPGLCRFYESLGYRRTGEKRRIQPGLDLVGYQKELAARE